MNTILCTQKTIFMLQLLPELCFNSIILLLTLKDRYVILHIKYNNIYWLIIIRIQIRLTNKVINQSILKHTIYWDDIYWNITILQAYQTKLTFLLYYSNILTHSLALKAVIYYYHQTKTERVFLVGFSKYRQDLPNDKIVAAHYMANLYCFGNKLCYHKVTAPNIETAKKLVKQRDHICKKYAQASQPICKYGMSYKQIKQYGKYLHNLLYVFFQKIPKFNEIICNQKLSQKHRQNKIKSYKINWKNIFCVYLEITKHGKNTRKIK